MLVPSSVSFFFWRGVFFENDNWKLSSIIQFVVGGVSFFLFRKKGDGTI